MGFFDKFFSKKDKEEPIEVEIVEEKEDQDNYEVQGLCDYCKDDIKTNEKMTKYSKVTFHRRCLKRMKKDAIKMTFG